MCVRLNCTFCCLCLCDGEAQKPRGATVGPAYQGGNNDNFARKVKVVNNPARAKNEEEERRWFVWVGNNVRIEIVKPESFAVFKDVYGATHTVGLETAMWGG